MQTPPARNSTKMNKSGGISLPFLQPKHEDKPNFPAISNSAYINRTYITACKKSTRNGNPASLSNSSDFDLPSTTVFQDHLQGTNTVTCHKNLRGDIVKDNLQEAIEKNCLHWLKKSLLMHPPSKDMNTHENQEPTNFSNTSRNAYSARCTETGHPQARDGFLTLCKRRCKMSKWQAKHTPSSSDSWYCANWHDNEGFVLRKNWI